MAVTRVPKVERHGTVSRYVNQKCRCDDCKAANTAYQREYRRHMKIYGP